MPRSGNPSAPASLSSVQAYSQIYNQIVQFDTTYTTKVVCDLCTEWEVSNGGKTFTFSLVDNAVWHDGTPLTAADVEYSMSRYMNPEVPIGRSGLFRNYTLPAEEGGVKMIDSTTVEFNLAFPSAAFIKFMALDYTKVLPKHVLELPEVENLKRADTVINKKAMSGPFILEEHRRGNFYKVSRNSNYFKENRPYLDSITHYIIVDTGTLIAVFKAGQLEMMNSGFSNLSPTEYLEVDADTVGADGGHVVAHELPGTRNWGLMINRKIEPFTDPRVRKAIYLALDYPQINDLVEGGTADPGCPMMGMGHSLDECANWPGIRPKNSAGGQENLEYARQLLAEAGYADGFETSYDVRQGQVGSYPDTCSVVKQQLEDNLGIRGEITVHESAAGYALYQTARPDDAVGDWGLSCQGEGMTVRDADALLGGVYLRGGTRNYTNWETETIRDLFEQQKVEQDIYRRREILQEIERYLVPTDPSNLGMGYEDNHWVTLYWGKYFWLVHEDIRGFNVPQTVQYGFKHEDLWLDRTKAPTPPPIPAGNCVQTVTADNLTGEWASGCVSENRPGSYARYYTFTLAAPSQVTVTLKSGDADTYLYLREGEATSGTALHQNDDHRGSTGTSQIQETLAADTYTVEATTHSAGFVGSFTLTITVGNLLTVNVSRAAGSEDTKARPGTSVSLTATFSRPVFGFTVGDIVVVNGDAGTFAGSDGDANYTFEVTPNAIGEVTVDIAAGAAEDTDGSGNTTAPRFSLGITYDDDGDSGISKAEAISAIRDYFSSEITKAQAIAVIVLYFSTPLEPGPGTPEGDRAALVALHDATGGPNWGRNNNWLSDVPISEWSGVTIDDNGRVTELRLDHNQLSGEIPPELGNLANLEYLRLDHNQLSGEIPPELGNLANLEYLRLDHNQLSGEIPPELGNLANLEYLRLDHNQLSGEIPPELGNLANLEYLRLDHNQLSGEIPPELGNLANLEYLNNGSSRLSRVRKRGSLICASRDDVPGFGYLDASGSNVGFDIDLCRAVATVVLGDPNAIEIRLITAAERGPTIQSGEVDLLVRTVTWTTSRDAQWGNYVQTMFYDGQGFMVRKNSSVTRVLQLRDTTVCVTQGTTTELNLQDFSNQYNLNIRPLTFEDTDAVSAAYQAGQCDAFTNDRSYLALIGSVFDDPSAHTILPETISEEPMAPVVPHGDDQWFDIVKTVMAILIYGEAYGISQGSVPSAATGTSVVDRLLGTEGSFGQESLGLSKTVGQNVLRAVGNYGEIYARNLGPGGINLPREGSRNALWADAPCRDCPKGGQIYAAPLR